MDLETGRTMRVVYAVVPLAVPAVMAGGLVVLIHMTNQAAAAAADQHVRKILTRVAWIELALLGMTMILLFGGAIRLFRFLLPRKNRTETPYVDAWAVAGERFELPTDTSDLDEDFPPEPEKEEEKDS